MIHNGTKMMLTSFLTYMLTCTLVGVLFCPASCSAASVSYPDRIKNTMEIFKSDEDAAKRVTDLVSLEKAKQASEERGLERKDLLATLMQLNGKADDSNSPLSQLKLFTKIAIADKTGTSEEESDNKADVINFEDKYPKFLRKSVDLTTDEPVQPISPGPVRYANYLAEATVIPPSQETAGKFENIRQVNPQEERSSTEEIATQRSIELNQLDEHIPISQSKKRLLGKLQVGNIPSENAFSKVFVNSNEEITTENESNARLQSNSKEMIEENEDTQSIIDKQPLRQRSPRMMTNIPQGNQIDIDEDLKNEDLNDGNTNITEKPTKNEDEVATENSILSKMFSNAKELFKQSNDQITMINKPQESQDFNEETPKSKQSEQDVENTNFTEKVPEMEERQEVTTEKNIYSNAEARPEEVSRESEDEEPIAQKVQRRTLRSQESKPQKIEIHEVLKNEDLDDENVNTTEKPTNNEDEDEEPIAQKVQRRTLRSQEGKPQKIEIDEGLKNENLNDENTNITEKPTNNENENEEPIAQKVQRRTLRSQEGKPQKIEIDEGLKNENLNDENTNITEKPTNNEDEDEEPIAQKVQRRTLRSQEGKPQKIEIDEGLKNENLNDENTNITEKPTNNEDEDEEPIAPKVQRRALRSQEGKPQKIEIDEGLKNEDLNDEITNITEKPTNNEDEDEEPIAQKVQRRALRSQEGKPQKIEIDEGLRNEDLNDEITNITEKPTNNEDEDEVATQKTILSKMFRNAKELFKKSNDQITMISKPQESQDFNEETPKSKQSEQDVKNTNFTEKVPEMEERQEVTTEKNMYSNAEARPEEVSRESEDEEPIAQKVQRRTLRSQEGKPQKNQSGEEDEPNREDTNINEKLSEIERKQKVTNINENDSEETEPEEQHRRQRSTMEQEIPLQKNQKSFNEEQIDDDKAFLEYTKPTEKVPELNERSSTTEKVPELNERTSMNEKALEKILSKLQTISEENENVVPVVGKLSSRSTTNILEEILHKNQKRLEEVTNGEEDQSSERTTTETLPEIENVQETVENLSKIKKYSQNMKDRSSLESDDILEQEPKSDKLQINHDTEGSSSENESQLSESGSEIVKEHNISNDQTEEMGVIPNNRTETENKGLPAGYFPLPLMYDIKEIPDSDKNENVQNSTFQEGILKLLSNLGGKQKLQEMFENDQGDPRVLAEKLVKKVINNMNNEDENSSNDSSTTRESEVQPQKSDNLNEAIEEERDISKPYDINENQLNETNTFESFSTTAVPTTADVRSEDIASKYQTEGTTSTTEKIIEALTSAAEESALKGTLGNSKDDEYTTKPKNNKGKIVFITSSPGATERQEDTSEEGKKVNADNEEVNESFVKDLDQETTDEPATSTQKLLTESNGKLIPISIFEVINTNKKINGSQLEEKKYNKDVDEEMIENEIPQNDKLQITPEEEETQKIKSESDKKSRKSINKSVELSSDENNEEEEEEPAKRKEDNDYKQDLEDSTYSKQKRNKEELENKNVTDDHEDLETDNSEGTTSSKPTEKTNKKKLRTEDDSINPEKTNEGIS